MLRLVGFFRALFNGSRTGDIGAEEEISAVLNLRSTVAFMSRVSFLTFLVASCTVGALSLAGGLVLIASIEDGANSCGMVLS